MRGFWRFFKHGRSGDRLTSLKVLNDERVARIKKWYGMQIEKGRIIIDFIEPNKRQYVIPVYQRNYEWTREQCVELFEDIVRAWQNDRTHFCGSLVYAQLRGTEYHLLCYYRRPTTIDDCLYSFEGSNRCGENGHGAGSGRKRFV